MTDGSRVTDNDVTQNVTLQDALPTSIWVTRPVAENITEAMEQAPMGAMAEIVYAVLARRLKMLLDPSSPLGSLLPSTFVHTAVQFMAVNPSALSDVAARVPAQASSADTYRSKIWGPNKDERLPHTAPLPTEAVPYTMGQQPGRIANAGLMVAKLFADLESHLPAVLFNITAKNYVPMNVGGSSVSRRIWQQGRVVTELVYRVVLTVEAALVTSDDESAAGLQAIVEATFGTLRDHIATGPLISGRTWQMALPSRLTPSSIVEVDAPWAAGDDKGAKLYTSTVGLEDMSFECIMLISKPVTLLLSDDPVAAGAGQAPGFSIPGERGDLTKPLKLKLGVPQRLIVTGAPLTAEVSVSQSKRVLDLRYPSQTGVYEIIPRRTGEAILRLYDTGMVVTAQVRDLPTSRTGEPLVERKVVVTAV